MDDEELEKIVTKESFLLKFGGIVLTLVASVMSAGIAVLNRGLKDVPYSVVLFYHSFFGMFTTFIFILVLVVFTSRPLYFLDFKPLDNLFLFGATGFDAIGVMTQTIAYQSGTAGFVSLISFVNIIYAMFADILIFNEPVSATQILSAIFILVICVGIGYKKIAYTKLRKRLIEATRVE